MLKRAVVSATNAAGLKIARTRAEEPMSRTARSSEAASWFTRVSLLVLVALGCVAAVTVPASAGTVATDQAAYAAGDVAIITGSGWASGELVELNFTQVPELHLADTLYAIAEADGAGNIYAAYVVPGHGEEQTFTLTATGQSSAPATAPVTFTNSLDFAWISPPTTPTALVQTDKSDYSPGETVIITGAGWAVGETVVLEIVESALSHPAETLHAIADSVGNIFAGYAVDEHDIGRTFTLTATGQTSGGTAETTFTDAPCTGQANVGDACDDGNACTTGETCQIVGSGQNKTCTGGTAISCDDGNVCTNDSCNTVSGCVHTNNAATCNDGLFCNGADTCSGGTCSSHAGDPCTGGAECNNVCNEAADNCFVAAETACTDDGTVCTADVCDGAGACAHPLTTCSLLTDSSLCTFDVDPNSAGGQFRLILTPDQNSPSAWKLNASNPGQFYYNILYIGPGNTTVNIDLPYPFVTQGAVPIHIYSDVTATPVDGFTCFDPGLGIEIANYSTQVTLANYSPQQFGTSALVTVTLPSLPGGFAYINIHLDYGLKRTNNYSKDASNNAIDATTLAIRILEKQSYVFADDSALGSGDTSQSENAFKRDPGIGGLVLESGTDEPVPNVTVQIYDSKNKLLATRYTDQDGWYMWQYKYTGKPATFTVKLPAYNLAQSVTLKSNGYLVVDFTVP